MSKTCKCCVHKEIWGYCITLVSLGNKSYMIVMSAACQANIRQSWLYNPLPVLKLSRILMVIISLPHQRDCSSYLLFGLLISSSHTHIWTKAPLLLTQRGGAKGREGVGDLGKNKGYCSGGKAVEETWVVVVDMQVYKARNSALLQVNNLLYSALSCDGDFIILTHTLTKLSGEAVF